MRPLLGPREPKSRGPLVAPTSLPVLVLVVLLLGAIAYLLVHESPVSIPSLLVTGLMTVILIAALAIWLKNLEGAQRDVRARELHYRTIFEESLEGIWQTTPSGHWISANTAMARMLGYDSPEEMLGANVDLNREFYVDPSRRTEFKRIMEHQDLLQDFESEVIAKDGRRMWIAESARAVRDASGAPLYFEGRTMDITARKQAEDALHKEYERQAVWVRELELRTREIGLLSDMTSMLQSCSRLDEAYAIVAEHTRWLFPGQAGALYVVGDARIYSERVAVWGTPAPPEAYIEPEDCWALRRGRPYRAVGPHRTEVSEAHPALFCRHVQAPLPEAALCVPLMAQGATLGLLHLRLLPLENNGGGAGGGQKEPYPEGQMQLAQAVAGGLAVAIANIRLQQTLHEQSIRDPLTGLFNRRHLYDALNRAVKRAEGQTEPLAILMVDIDHFKSFNDTHGHEAGDAMLHELGRFLTTEIRDGDIACRYGGEEFALILPGATIQASRERAESLRRGAREITVLYHREQLGPVSLSIGLAHMPSHASTPQELLRAADAALYRAKAKGRDQVRLAEVREGAELSPGRT
jgi:diguanylate cyclase (GGDEF)-like protein/PAS domain S-box-containing protein